MRGRAPDRSGIADAQSDPDFAGGYPEVYIVETPKGGKSFHVSAAVIGSNKAVRSWRYIAGTLQIRIPVSTKEIILWPVQNTFAILKWRLQYMALSNRWYPVLQRYIEIIAGRVQGLGVNPSQIPPSLTGYQPVPGQGAGGERDKCYEEFTGKVIGIVYDRFGDFIGFRFLTEEGHEISFHGREREVESLVYRAWQEEILITVRIEAHEKHWPASIIYRRMP
jgi:hypothetical protein